MYLGVDGCPYGWFIVALDENWYETRVCRTFGELLDFYRNAELILVDVPIGLPEGEAGRACDAEARNLVGNLHATVYPTPTRGTIEQIPPLVDCLDATHLRYRFEHHAVDGINLQTFAISHKIAEVDLAIRAQVQNAQPEVREVHPEVCFWALNGHVPLNHRKVTPLGQAERLGILGNYLNHPCVQGILDGALARFPRSHVRRDDVIDAMAAAITGYNSQGNLQSLPDPPPHDPMYQGLLMEMAYWPERPAGG